MPDIHVRQRQNILWLIIDRPPLNTLTAAALNQLTTAMRKAVQQPPRLVVITGMGERAFCAGIDLPDDSEDQRSALTGFPPSRLSKVVHLAPAVNWWRSAIPLSRARMPSSACRR